MAALQPMWLRKEEVPTLPDGWKAMQTSEVTVQLKPGKLFEKRTVTETGLVPVLSQGESGFIGYHDETPGVTASPDIPVVTFANHTCAMRLMKRPFSCIQNIFPKIGREDVCDTLYFYYAALGRVTISDYKGHHPLFRQTYIPVPPLSTQWKIAVILSAYDDLIENNLRRIKILEEMAQNLYREWFVKFHFPGHQHARFTDSPLGPIPEKWEVKRLGKLVRIDKGVSYKGEFLTDDGIPMVNLKCIPPGGGFNRDGTKPYSGEHKPRHKVMSGDLVFANTDLTQAGNIIGSPGIVPRYGFEGGGLASHHICIVRPDEQCSLRRMFLFHLLQSGGFREYAKGRASGTTVLGFRPDDALDFEFAIPPLQLTDQFEETAENLYDLGESLRDRNIALRRTRDLLLPRLISGEVDVSELDIAVPQEVMT